MLHRLGWLGVSWLTRDVIFGWLDKALRDSTVQHEYNNANGKKQVIFFGYSLVLW